MGLLTRGVFPFLNLRFAIYVFRAGKLQVLVKNLTSKKIQSITIRSESISRRNPIHSITRWQVSLTWSFWRSSTWSDTRLKTGIGLVVTANNLKYIFSPQIGHISNLCQCRTFSKGWRSFYLIRWLIIKVTRVLAKQITYDDGPVDVVWWPWR